MVTNPSTIRSILRVFAAAAVAIAATASAQAQLTTWTGNANSTWSDAGNWSNAVPNTTTGTAVFTSTATTTTVTGTARIDLRSLVFQSGALAYTIGPNFGINGTPATITVESGVSTNQTINGNVRNAAGTTATITNNGTGLLNFPGQFFSGGAWTVTFDGSGDITARRIDQQNSAGVFSIVKNGAGTLTLTTGLSTAAAASTGHYTGSTTINGGVLQLGDANSMGGSTTGTGAITFGGGTLRYGSATVDYSSRIRSSGSAIAIDTGTLAAVTFASALPASNTGGLTKSGTGTLTLSAANLYTGTTTISAGQLSLSGGDDRLAAASPITITGGVLDLGNRGQSTSGAISFQGGTVQSGTLTSTAGAFDGRAGTVSAILAGSGIGLTKTTSGTLTLAGANTYSGGTDVNAGTLAFDRVSALNSSSGVNVAAGAILDYTGAAGTLSRNVTVSSSGTGTIRNSGGQALTLSGTLTKDGRVLRLTGGTFNVTGQIVGASANSDLLVDGTSTVTLSSANTYNGPTFVNQASTLIVGINDAIPSNSTVTLGDATSTGTLDLGTFANQIGGLVFSGSGGTLRMAANQTASPQLSTSSSLTLGSNASLDLTGMQTSAGNYRLISSTGLSSGTFGSVTGLNSNYVLRYGTVNADEISAQRKAEFGTITATPAAVSIITGGSTAFSYTVANATPTDGSTLSFTSSNGANVIGSSSGTAGANATSASISGLVFTGTGVGLNQTGSFTLTDPNAISTTANGSVSVNVLNHSLASFAATDTATKTLDFGSYDAGSWSGGDGGNGSLAYSIFNIASLGFSNAETAGLNFYGWEFASGDDVFSVGFSSFANLAAGSSNGFFATVMSPGGLAEGSYSGTYTLKFRDQQDLSGAANTRNLSLTMNVVVVPEPGAIALAAIGVAAAAWARRRSR